MERFNKNIAFMSLVINPILVSILSVIFTHTYKIGETNSMIIKYFLPN
jgi:hypothetical protein